MRTRYRVHIVVTIRAIIAVSIVTFVFVLVFSIVFLLFLVHLSGVTINRPATTTYVGVCMEVSGRRSAILM